MALNVKCGTFALGTGVAGTTVTLSLGFQAKALLLFWNGHGSADAVSGATHVRGAGFATSATAFRSWCSRDADAAGTSDTDCMYRTDSAVFILSSTATAGTADIQSINSTEVVFEILTQFAVNVRVGYIALGGDDITGVEIGQFTPTGTAPVNQIVSTGFQGKAVFFGGVRAATANTITAHNHAFFGAATSSTKEYVWAGGAANAQASGSTGSYCRAGECIAEMSQVPTGVSNRAEFVSFNATPSFTINWLERTTANPVHYLLLGGNFSVDLGDILTRTTTGTITETGLAFEPDLLLLASHCKAQNAADTASTDDELSLGAYDGTDMWGIQSSSRSGNTTMFVQISVSSDSVYQNVAVATDLLEGEINTPAFTSDGFTLNQNDADPVAAFAWYVAFAGTAGGTQSGAGAVVAGATATAVGRSTAASPGAATAGAALAGVGRSTAASDGAASVGAVVAGVGVALAPGSGSITASATPQAVGRSTAASAGSAGASATPAAIGAAQSSASGAALAGATASGAGRSFAASAGTTSVGAVVAATGSVIVAAIGSIAVSATLSGGGIALKPASGSITASATPQAVGQSTAASAGSASASAAATATGAGTFSASGAVLAGVTGASGVGRATVASAGSTTATATATGAGSSRAAGAGAILASALPAATSQGTVLGAGSITVGATVTGVGQSTAVSAGSTTATVTATAVGVALRPGAGSIAVTATVAAQGRSTASGAGAASASATIEATGGARIPATGSASASATATGAGTALKPAGGAITASASPQAAGAAISAGAGGILAGAGASATGSSTARTTGMVEVAVVATGAGDSEGGVEPGDGAVTVVVIASAIAAPRASGTGAATAGAQLVGVGFSAVRRDAEGSAFVRARVLGTGTSRDINAITACAKFARVVTTNCARIRRVATFAPAREE